MDNANWTEAAESLITFADLIVSEPLRLSDGVRLKLEMIYRLRRRDGTVLMLSPLEHVIRRNPGRFEIRPRHGPLRKRRTRELTE